jgi:hypothetical protein
MVAEVFYSEEGKFSGWRCVWCGEIIDVIILENRGVPRNLLISAGLISTTTLPPEVQAIQQATSFRSRSWRNEPFL